MDEILIEEKKYISSKQAAKITGYAKDYIGQLCREGRVPARLVGRSWYVLETALQDHRFGSTDIQQNESTEAIVHQEEKATTAWESPRYEVYSDNLQDSWKEWFDRVSDTKINTSVIEKTKETLETKKEEEMNVMDKQEEVSKIEKIEENSEEDEVNVPLHVLYQEPPSELLPHNVVEKGIVENLVQNEEKPKIANKIIIKTIQTGSILLAIIFALLAIVNSGYLDEYLISNSQVKIISGVIFYNK